MVIASYSPRRMPPPAGFSEEEPSLRKENPLALQALDLAHAGTEVLLDHAHSGTGLTAAGVGSAAVSLGALAWGASKLGSDAMVDRIEGVGAMALGLSSAATAAAALQGGHGHGPMVAGLGVVHGAADAAVAVHDLAWARRTGKATWWAAGLFQTAKAAATMTSHLVPGLAPAAHLVLLGSVLGRSLAINLEQSR